MLIQKIKSNTKLLFIQIIILPLQSNWCFKVSNSYMRMLINLIARYYINVTTIVQGI